jgi:hypothetical protein
MAAGELENYKAFADTIHQNVKAILQHGNETRKMLRTLEEKVEHQEKDLRLKDQKIEELRGLITNLQARVYAGGT